MRKRVWHIKKGAERGMMGNREIMKSRMMNVIVVAAADVGKPSVRSLIQKHHGMLFFFLSLKEA